MSANTLAPNARKAARLCAKKHSNKSVCAPQVHFQEVHEAQMNPVRADQAAFAAFMRTPGAPEQFFAAHRLLYGKPGAAGGGEGGDTEGAKFELRSALVDAGCEVLPALAREG